MLFMHLLIRIKFPLWNYAFRLSRLNLTLCYGAWSFYSFILNPLLWYLCAKNYLLLYDTFYWGYNNLITGPMNIVCENSYTEIQSAYFLKDLNYSNVLQKLVLYSLLKLQWLTSIFKQFPSPLWFINIFIY